MNTLIYYTDFITDSNENLEINVEARYRIDKQSSENLSIFEIENAFSI